METKAKILIIDDDFDFREALRLSLTAMGYSVSVAGDLEEGYKALRADSPSLLILDVMLKRLDDGFNMCYELKHSPEFKDLPIIIVTSVTQATGLKFNPETDGEYLEADAYFQKPVSMEAIQAEIERLLKGHSK